jgi:hypothetical protein
LSNENADDKIKSEMKTNEGVNEAKLKPPQVAQTFQSTIIPTISSVNLVQLKNLKLISMSQNHF